MSTEDNSPTPSQQREDDSFSQNTATQHDSAETRTHEFRARIVSFAGRSARLKGRQERAWDELAPTYVIEPERTISRTSIASHARLDIDAAFSRSGAPTIVEIGSGQGECVANAALTHPETNFLPIEVYRPGIASTLYRIRKHKLNNIRIVQADAAEALGHFLPGSSLTELWTFFPDPWHKSRHHKRRLIQPEFTPKAARVLKEGGVWRLATDWVEYAEHMVEVINASPYFDLVSDSERFTGRVITSFERKGLEKGRVITDLTYRRNAIPVSADDIARMSDSYAHVHQPSSDVARDED